MTDDLSAAHDDRTVAVVEGRFGGLLEAEVEVIVGLHGVDGLIGWLGWCSFKSDVGWCW
jgi:hypothetical protein